MRRTTTLTALLLGATLLAPTGVATAVGETCRGEAATIVGTGPTVTGTTGDDVIVTGASLTVFADAGNDLVCVTPMPSSVTIDTGDGDDVLDASAAKFGTYSSLQSGRDQFLGGPGVDFVTANGADDVVLGGAGSDNVTLLTSQSVTTVVGSYDGGTGDDGIFVQDRVADIDMELDEQVVVGGIVVADITGFIHGGASAPRVTLRGNAEDNSLYASGCDLRVNGEGGDDRVAAGYDEDGNFPQPCDRRARLSGGRGDDAVYGWTGGDRLAGNAGDDNVHGRGDADLLLGGAGDDNLVGGGGPDVLRGQRGRDKLIGNPGGDTLVGDQGRDLAGGGAGRDRCRAEVERRCEHR